MDILRKASLTIGQAAAVTQKFATDFAEKNDLKGKQQALGQKTNEMYTKATGRSVEQDGIALRNTVSAAAAAVDSALKPVVQKASTAVNQGYSTVTGRELPQDVSKVGTSCKAVSDSVSASYEDGKTNRKSVAKVSSEPPTQEDIKNTAQVFSNPPEYSEKELH
jgi:hypothetical protein